MKRVVSLLSVCAMLLGMVACSDNILEEEFVNESGVQTKTVADAIAPETSTLAYILSEGNWYSSVMGSISKFNPSAQTITPGYFKTVNGVELGDTGNEMILHEGLIYCLVSGHDLTSNNGGLWVIDPKTCKAMTSGLIQYNDPKQTGYKAMPRHMAFYNGKIYISLYSGAVIAVSVSDPSAVIGTKILPAKFSEGICVVNNIVYVCNSGNENDETAGKGNTISYFSANAMDGTSQNVLTMTSALNPKLIKYSSTTGRFYYNALGEGAMNTSLHYFINPKAGYETIANVKASDFDMTDGYIYTVDINWSTYQTSIWKVDISNNIGTPFKMSSAPRLFGLSVKYHNDRLYVGESMGPRMYVFNEPEEAYLYLVNTGTYNVNSVVFVN